MKLYTCGMTDSGPSLLHPCAHAIKALRNAGYEFEIETVEGYRLMPWTRGGDARAEIEKMSGQKNVPVLVLDDGEVISGCNAVARWVRKNPLPQHAVPAH